MIQVKFNQKMNIFSNSLKLPTQKFLKEIIYGILSSRSCIVRKIAQSLDSKITLKKLQERLTYHLDKPELENLLIQTTENIQSKKLKKNSLIIVDPSDIVKKYAKSSEGISRVRDGSDGEWKNGYELLDIVGVNPESSGIIPLVSELYSNEVDLDSLKNRLFFRLEDLIVFSGNKAVTVFDRGFDDKKVFRFLHENEIPFIIRAKNNRNLIHINESRNILEIAKKVKLKKVFKEGKKTIKAGFTNVQIPVDPHPIKKNPYLVDAQLVVGYITSYKNKKGGIFYFLCGNLNERFDSEKEFITFVLQSYKSRWKIEEVHRHVKQDFKWEEIKLQKYQRLKNMNLLLWLAICFVYEMSKFQNFFIREAPNLILDKKKLSDLPKFTYYRISNIVTTSFRLFSIRRKPPKNQLNEFVQLKVIGF